MVDDEDDFDEEAIPGFSHPSMNASPTSATLDKGKGRAPEQLAAPSGSNYPHTPVSGNIGSASAGATTSSSARRTVGGVQVETRYGTLSRCSVEAGVCQHLSYNQVYWS